MRILIALDAFKDGCSSIDACQAVAEGIRQVDSEIEVVLFPISDGGEGAVDVLHFHCGGTLIEGTVRDPLFRTTFMEWLMLDDGTAIIEMASMAGLELLAMHERNPMNTSTFGLGEVIKSALSRDCSKICLTLGGSATNDLGMGMVSALGGQFLDESGNPLTPIGGNMSKVSRIDLSGLNFEGVVEAWTDVENTLFGPNGAAFTYGAQKGASDTEIAALEDGARHLSDLWQAAKPQSKSATVRGGGAAGGLGAGIHWFLDGQLRSGFEAIAEMTELAKYIETCDHIITGEGHFDHQSVQGKVVGRMLSIAKEEDKKIDIFTGKSSMETDIAVWDINAFKPSTSLADQLANSAKNLKETGRRWAQRHL